VGERLQVGCCDLYNAILITQPVQTNMIGRLISQKLSGGGGIKPIYALLITLLRGPLNVRRKRSHQKLRR